MRSRGPSVLAGAVVALVACAVAVVAAGGPSADVARRGRAFQRLVGGLGAGPALDLSRCAAAFDPRVEDECRERWEPLPAGDAYCPLGPARDPAAGRGAPR